MEGCCKTMKKSVREALQQNWVNFNCQNRKTFFGKKNLLKIFLWSLKFFWSKNNWSK